MYYERDKIIKKTPYKKWKNNLIDFYGYDKGGLVFFKSIYEYNVCRLNIDKQINSCLDNKVKYYLLPIISLYKGFKIAGFTEKESMENIENLLKLQHDGNNIVQKILIRIKFVYFIKVLRTYEKQYRNINKSSRYYKLDSYDSIDSDIKNVFYNIVLHQFHSKELLDLICRIDNRIFDKIIDLGVSKFKFTLGSKEDKVSL